MKTSSLELCRELYELSGWENTEHWYMETNNGNEWVVGLAHSRPKNKIMPAYDLGYLLRKLPNYVKLFRNDKGIWFAAAVTGSFRHPSNKFSPPDQAHDWSEADTPEDAATKLAIELFKQGVL